MKRGYRNGCLVLGLFAALSQPVVAWQPVKPVKLVVPAASGSGADRMAELIVRLAKQHELLSQPLYVTNEEPHFAAIIAANRGAVVNITAVGAERTAARPLVSSEVTT